MKSWIAANYPGTKTAITEYNWGAQEHISGAVAQADILGIFGREGLDVGTVWGPPDSKTQVPGMMAFKIFRNYDNAAGEFGNMSLKATSDDQAKLSIYAAQRKDNVVTVMVINKSFGGLKSDVVLAHLTAGKAKGVSVQQCGPVGHQGAAGCGSGRQGGHEQHQECDIPGDVDHAVRGAEKVVGIVPHLLTTSKAGAAYAAAFDSLSECSIWSRYETPHCFLFLLPDLSARRSGAGASQRSGR